MIWMTVFISLAISVLMMADPAMAQLKFSLKDYRKIDRPCVKPPKPPIGKSRVNLARFRPFLYQLGSDVYAVPYAYLIGVNRDVPSCRRDFPALSFQFWIPDGQPPEKIAARNYIERPKERKRPNPSKEEWVVTSEALKYFEDRPEIRGDADRQIHNEKEHYTFHYSAALDLYVHRRNANIHPERFYTQNDGFSLYAWCFEPIDVKSSCIMTVTFHQRKLAGRFLVSTRAVPFYKNIITTVETLLDRWHLE